MINAKNKPIASLSLDLDNKWSYMKTHGDSGWETFPSYLDIVVPRFIEFLGGKNLTITVFIVGQDAALEKNHAALRAIADAGHEIGNHSFKHEPWLHLYSEEEIEKEIAIAEYHIEQATGKKTIGFRGPGYSISRSTLQVLARRGYEYEASTFPTFLGPLARAYYFMTSKLSQEEMEQRQALFGRFSEGFRPLKPYQWLLNPGELIEIPVTTLPIFKVPIHFSYLLYLSVFSPPLARLYFDIALKLCRLTGTQPSLLLHPLDFLGGDDIPELSFFPAMNLPGGKKLALLSKLIGLLSDQFTIVTIQEHAQLATERFKLPRVEPHFRQVGV
jgi:peptidoglycan-N-acetylglucosamine deacetylase